MLLGLLDQALVPTDPQDLTKPALVREELHLERALQLLSKPMAHAKAVYGWGESSFRGELLLARLRDVLAGYGFNTTFTPAAPSTPSSLDIRIFTLRENRDGPLPGLEVELRVPISDGMSFRLPLFQGFAIEISSKGSFESGLKLVIAPPAELIWQPVTATLAGALQVSLVGESEDPTKPFLILGATGGSRLEATQVSLKAGVSAEGSAGALSPRGAVLAAAEIKGGKLLLDMGAGDGFLSSFLSGRRFESDVDAALTWTPENGLHFKGSAGLEVSLPVNRVVGPLQFQTLHLGATLDSSAGRLPVEISAGLSGKLGPLTVTVDRLGLEAQLGFPRTGGNLGPVDFGLGFKPPSGVGLVVDAELVTGGGFLAFDRAKEEYGGVLELQIAETIGVKAIGVLTTRLPDGARGYSLFLILFAEDFPPIQLGLGFALTGIGGLLAINRTFDEVAVRDGLKSRALDSILFAQDPVRNAPQIISNLNKVFPPAEGHHLFGPMVQIVWGTPALITVNLALVLEFGERLRLARAGADRAILPTRDNDLLRLQMDAAGVLDFDQGTAVVDATLHDSRLLKKFVLTGRHGDAARLEGVAQLRAGRGRPSSGVQPASQLPQAGAHRAEPQLRRQPAHPLRGLLRAHREHAAVRREGRASCRGGGVQHRGRHRLRCADPDDPFAFVAEFHAQIQLKRGSTNLFKVKVEGVLVGPSPAAHQGEGHVRDPLVGRLRHGRQDAAGGGAAAAAGAGRRARARAGGAW